MKTVTKSVLKTRYGSNAYRVMKSTDRNGKRYFLYQNGVLIHTSDHFGDTIFFLFEAEKKKSEKPLPLWE